MKKINKKDLIYIAGFFDGEGSISITKTMQKQKKGNSFLRYTLTCSVVNNNKYIIYWIKNLFEGFIFKQKHENILRKDTYIFICSCKKAIKFLKYLLPYLKIKNKRAKLAMEFQKLCKIGNRYISKEITEKKEYYRQQISKLNRENGNGRTETSTN